MTHAHRVDSTQKDIVTALRKAGCSVAITSGAGDGFPDLVVYRPRVSTKDLEGLYLLEVKTRGGKLTPAQEKFHGKWKGPIHIVTSVDEALIVVGVLER